MYLCQQNDAVVGAVVSFSDITDRKQAELALTRERDFAERLIQTAPVIVLVLDPDGNIIRVNSFMENLSGYSLAEVKGKSRFEHFLTERDVPRVTQVFERAKGGVRTSGNVNAIVTRNGGKRLNAWYDTVLRNPDGELTAVLAIGHDVTDEKAKEAQLLQVQKMETVGELTGGIAHDFNNLLTVILGNLDLAITTIDRENEHNLSELLGDALSAARDGAELCKRLLAFSRKEPMKQERIDLPVFLKRFQRFLQRTLCADIDISVDIEANIEQFFCDPPQLESTLLNLALNARDAMPAGGKLSLQALAKQAADIDPSLQPGIYVALAVIDTGEGMTPDHLARAVEPFYTTKRRTQGSGLGLSMVFGFCEQAGGRFQLRSEPGVGTRATIIVPLNAGTGQGADQTPDPQTTLVAGRGSVLVVEDEDRVRKLAQRYLEALGYHVLVAETGDRAIELFQSELGIDLVFSDIVMPGKTSGCDLYRCVRKNYPGVMVLLTTGLRSAELNALAEDDTSPTPIVIPKPYSKEQLAAAILRVAGT